MSSRILRVDKTNHLFLESTIRSGWDPALSLSRPTSTSIGLFEVSITKDFVVLNIPLIGPLVVRIRPEVANRVYKGGNC